MGMKHYLPYAVVLAALMIIVAVSCNKTDDFQTDFKYEYFPTDSGRYVEYQVDSITWNSFFDPPQVDTVQFYVREEYKETFTDGGGNQVRRIERFSRTDTSLPWMLTDVWSAGIDANKAIWNEENLRFVKLVFPPTPGLTWRGNQFINVDEGPNFLDDWTYELTELDVVKSVNGMNFDSTLTVILHADSNLIEKTYAREVYAKGVGLVEKEWQWLTKNNVNVPFPQGTEDGFIIKQRVTAYSN